MDEQPFPFWLALLALRPPPNASSSLKKRITTREFAHRWDQSSIVRTRDLFDPPDGPDKSHLQITSINGTNSPDEVVVISARQDRYVLVNPQVLTMMLTPSASTNMWPLLPAPGEFSFTQESVFVSLIRDLRRRRRRC